MAQEYVITGVKIPPKQWDSKFGPMHTYLIAIKGNGEPVQLNKKAGSPAPSVGETIYGEILNTEYGQKFKSQKKPFTPGGGSNRDSAAIQAQWAIGQAVQVCMVSGDLDEGAIEQQATMFFAMIDRVKQSNVVSRDTAPKHNTTGYTKAGNFKTGDTLAPVWDEVDLNNIFEE